MLESLADGLWVWNAPQILHSLDFGHRMTVVRLGEGGLWVHSPAAWSLELAEELAALGPVRHLVAPSLFHDLHLAEWRQAYPEAKLHGAPGLAAAYPALRWDAELADGAPDPDWGADLAVVLLDGMPKVNEVVFVHRPSHTLIVADFLFNIRHRARLRDRMFFRLTGAYGRPTMSLAYRMFIRDFAAFEASLDRLLAEDFDRLVVGHGDVLETGAYAVVKRLRGRR